MDKATTITIGVNVLLDAVAAALRAKQASELSEAEREAFIVDLRAQSEAATREAGEAWDRAGEPA